MSRMKLLIDQMQKSDPKIKPIPHAIFNRILFRFVTEVMMIARKNIVSTIEDMPDFIYPATPSSNPPWKAKTKKVGIPIKNKIPNRIKMKKAHLYLKSLFFS